MRKVCLTQPTISGDLIAHPLQDPGRTKEDMGGGGAGGIFFQEASEASGQDGELPTGLPF